MHYWTRAALEHDWTGAALEHHLRITVGILSGGILSAEVFGEVISGGLFT